MTSFVETCYLNRDNISMTTPSINTHKSTFHSHQRSNSSQLTYSTQMQSPAISAFTYPVQLSELSLNKNEPEPNSFQTPTTYSQVTNKSMIKQDFFSEMIKKKTSQTRVSRVYNLEDMKPEQTSKISANKTEQASNEYTTTNSTNQQNSEISSTTSSPSLLLLQFGNMDLRKRQSLFPVKPVEMSFDKQLEFKLGSKFRNLKIDDKLGDKGNIDASISDLEENDTNKIQKHYIIDDIDNSGDDDIELDNDKDIDLDKDEDEDDAQEYTIEDSLYDNLIFEIKSERNHLIKSILKKSSSIQRREHLSTCPDYSNSQQNQNISIKQSQNILQYQRSSSLQELSSLNINSSIETLYQINQQQYFSPTKNTQKEEDYTNLIMNKDFNLELNQLPHTISKDYQPSDMITSTERVKPQMQRSQSFTGLTKKVTFMISPSKEDTITNIQSSLSDLPQTQCLSINPQSSSLSNLQINSKKTNSFNKFYSAFKQSLISSQSEIFSTPQEKQIMNRSNNNSTSSTVSTIPSLSSFSQCFSLQNGIYLQSTPSSTCSTPLASQSSMSNIISPLVNQQNFERKNLSASSQSSILTAFKDMKLTKNTKLYLDQKMKKPSSVPSRVSENISYLKSNSESAFNPDSPTLVKLSYEDFRYSPSSDFISRSANS